VTQNNPEFTSDPPTIWLIDAVFGIEDKMSEVCSGMIRKYDQSETRMIYNYFIFLLSSQ